LNILTQGAKKPDVKYIVFLAIPLVLSAYTHLWNIIGFPSIHIDESHYMRRAMLVISNLGPQDPYYPYDHPYFGQIFLAGILGMIGYPNSLNLSPNGDVHSIEMLYLIPRLLMGILAIVDTFLVYKIAEYRHGRNVALASSVVFAVMPLSWLYRWILLDSILLPFLLSSILLAVYLKKLSDRNSNNHIKDNKLDIKIPILLSGILLGLAIYTKIPAFTMIPLVGFLVYKNSNKSWKLLGLWFIPVILIPLMWPAYSISVGQFDEWLHGILWQGTERHTGSIIPDIKLNELLRADPFLIVIGTAGIIILAAIRKDFYLLLWVVPNLVFQIGVGWVVLFHWIPVLPAFCIGIGILIEIISRSITKKKTLQKFLILASISAIGIFGLVSTSIIIRTNFSSSEFQAAAFVANYIHHIGTNNDMGNRGPSQNVTIITSPIYSWIFKYILGNTHVSSHIRDPIPIQTNKVILIADGVYQSFLSKETQEDPKQFDRIQTLYKNTRAIALFDTNSRYFKYVRDFFPFSGIITYAWSKAIIIKANY